MTEEELKKEIEDTLNNKTLCYEDTIQKVEVLKSELKGIQEGKKECLRIAEECADHHGIINLDEFKEKIKEKK